jgi:hypothetical protein
MINKQAKKKMMDKRIVMVSLMMKIYRIKF